MISDRRLTIADHECPVMEIANISRDVIPSSAPLAGAREGSGEGLFHVLIEDMTLIRTNTSLQ